jgi:Domain of unknown function (DUF4386)
MSTAVVATTHLKVGASPPARIAGFFYLLVFIFNGSVLFVRRGLVISDDAATASNILAHASRLWLGLTCNLMMIACFVVVTALFYELFKPVNRSVSLLAAFFSLMGCAAQTFSFLFYIAPLVVLQDAPNLGAFKAEQLQAMALMLFKLFARASGIGSAFFGFYCLLIGYLVFRSTFLPRILGVLMMIAGVGALTLLYPPLANSLRPYNLALAILGEGSLTLWLLAMGVNVERWKEQSGLKGTQ